MYIVKVKYVGGDYNGHEEKFPFKQKEMAEEFCRDMWEEEIHYGGTVIRDKKKTFYDAEKKIGFVTKPSETVIFSLEENNNGTEGYVSINGKENYIFDLLKELNF